MSSPAVNLALGLLAHASKITNSQTLAVRELFQRYVLPWDGGEFNWIISRASSSDFVDLSAETEDPLDRKAHLTLAGLNRVNLVFGENLATALEQNGVYLKSESRPSEIAEQPSIDSSTWTGLPAGFVLSNDRKDAIVRALDGVEQSLPQSKATQHDQAQARAYIVAARALLEAPEPDPAAAWELIGRANSLAGIASLLVAIIALFMAR